MTSNPPTPQMPKPRLQTTPFGPEKGWWSCWPQSNGTTTIEQSWQEQAEAAAREKAAREDYEQMALDEARRRDEVLSQLKEKVDRVEELEKRVAELEEAFKSAYDSLDSLEACAKATNKRIVEHVINRATTTLNRHVVMRAELLHPYTNPDEKGAEG